MDEIFESRIPRWEYTHDRHNGLKHCYRCKEKDYNWKGVVRIKGRSLFGKKVVVYSCMDHIGGLGAQWLREVEKVERPKAELLLTLYLPKVLKDLLENGRIKFE